MPVHFETRAHIAIITLDRPEARNAIDERLASELEEALDRLDRDEALWSGLLCGAGPVFCAGADLKAIASGNANLSTQRGGFAGIVERKRTKPLIAVVEGPALAGGCEVVLSCDLVVAGDKAEFGLPEVKRSLVAYAGGLLRLPHVLPRNIAMEMALTGDPIDALRAHHYGMVNKLVPAGEALKAGIELANRIGANAPLAVRATRDVILDSYGSDEDAGFALSRQALQQLSKTEDFREGPRSFVEKRAPQWKGR